MESADGVRKAARFVEFERNAVICAVSFFGGWVVFVLWCIIIGAIYAPFFYSVLWSLATAGVYVSRVCADRNEMRWGAILAASVFMCKVCNRLRRKLPCLSEKYDSSYGGFVTYAEEFLGVPSSESSVWFIEYLLISGRVPIDDFHPQLIVKPEHWHLLRRYGMNVHAPSLPVPDLEKIDRGCVFPPHGAIVPTDSSCGPAYIFPDNVPDVYDMVVQHIRECNPDFDPERE